MSSLYYFGAGFYLMYALWAVEWWLRLRRTQKPSWLEIGKMQHENNTLKGYVQAIEDEWQSNGWEPPETKEEGWGS